MRHVVLTLLVMLSACGNDHDLNADGNFPPPRVISGGGIGDGAIDGVVNLHVIDDVTREPIEGAEVEVGELAGETDASGLFVVEGVIGPQTIVVSAPARRTEMWVGANGANITVNLVARDAAPATAELSGSITGFETIVVAPQHAKAAVVVASQTDELGDPVNELDQLGRNVCIAFATIDPCDYVLTSRTGKVALVAMIFDIDTKGTDTTSDDVAQVVGWASATGLVVAAGVNQTGRNLTRLPANMLDTVTVSFGTTPYTSALGLVAIELGEEGLLALPAVGTPVVVTPASPTLLVPRPAAFGTAARYRLTALSGGSTEMSPSSAVVRRHLTGPTLDAMDWLGAPGGVTATTTGAAWTAAPGATLHGVEYRSGATRILNVSALDGSTTITVPPRQLPSGDLTINVSAIGAPGLDVTDFALDSDRDKIVQFSTQPIRISL